MASSAPAISGFPAGFTVPFKRVVMQERIDDALACVAILTNQTLPVVTAAAIKLGYPANGPAWATYDLIARLLFQLGNLKSTDYQEITSLPVLPFVAILLVDYDPDTEIGRHVVWHHVKASDKSPSFHYVIDPANWIDDKHHVTTHLHHLKITGGYYIEIKQPTYASIKGK